MTDLNITRNDGESFREFHLRAATEVALYYQNLISARRYNLAKALRIESYALLTVINLDGEDSDIDGTTGTFVTRISSRFGQEETLYWTTVIDGKSDSIMFEDREYAVLHALARESGVDVNAARHLVPAAARVLDIRPNGSED